MKKEPKYRKPNNTGLDSINEDGLDGSYTNSANFGQSNRSFDDETYNNTQASIGYNNSSFGYNNSSIGYNNTQPSLGYSNDNEEIETSRGARKASYLPHN